MKPLTILLYALIAISIAISGYIVVRWFNNPSWSQMELLQNNWPIILAGLIVAGLAGYVINKHE